MCTSAECLEQKCSMNFSCYCYIMIMVPPTSHTQQIQLLETVQWCLSSGLSSFLPTESTPLFLHSGKHWDNHGNNNPIVFIRHGHICFPMRPPTTTLKINDNDLVAPFYRWGKKRFNDFPKLIIGTLGLEAISFSVSLGWVESVLVKRPSPSLEC